MGTWREMEREKVQVDVTMRPKVSMLAPGTDCSVVVLKLGNASGAKGVGHPLHDRLIVTNRKREESFDMKEGVGLQGMARAV